MLPPSDEIPHQEAIRRSPIRRTTMAESAPTPALRNLQRLVRAHPRDQWVLPKPVAIDATFSSFALDGISLTLNEVSRSVSHRQSVRAFRSRSYQRVRNHVALLYSAERLILLQRPLTRELILRWYASISNGLCTTMLAPAKLARVDAVARQINSPKAKLHAAIADASELHLALLRDELVPSFNGILSRLLLHVHLARSGLFPVLFEPATDRPLLATAVDLMPRLIELLEQRYELAT
jgi:hypothetical protein